MQYDQYRFKFYFDASHSIYIAGTLGQSHPHTWEVIINTVRVRKSFVPFDKIEKKVESFLSQYQDTYINSIEPFTTINPTLENICNYFKESIQFMLYEDGWLLLSIEISETPVRSYIINLSDEIDYEAAFSNIPKDNKEQEIVENLVDEKLNKLSQIKLFKRAKIQAGKDKPDKKE